MSQAIVTKYLPATDRRGARMKASAFGGSVTVPYAYEGGESWRAALALIRKMGWPETGWTEGGMPDGQCMVFVRDPSPVLRGCLTNAADALEQWTREHPLHDYSQHCRDIVKNAREAIAQAPGARPIREA